MAPTVILGSGIIGLSVAYYLADHQPPETIHLVDPSQELFSSASGFAGGFVARDWYAGPLAALGAVSFEEHSRLAEKEGGRERWGYSRSTAYSYSRIERLEKNVMRDWQQGEESNKATQNPLWLRRAGRDCVEVISGPESTAQVDPRRLCRFLLERCLAMGVKLHHPAKALSVAADVQGQLSSVCIGCLDSSTETDVPCTRLVVAAGAWSSRVFGDLFRNRGVVPVVMGNVAGYSLVLKEPDLDEEEEGGNKNKECCAVFCTGDGSFEPEIFSRVGNEIYVSGLNPTNLDLPDIPGSQQRNISTEQVAELEKVAEKLIRTNPKKKKELEILRRALCFRPVTPSGLPVVGRVPDGNLGIGMGTRAGSGGGVFFAAGHGPWGISLSLGTGRVLSEVMQGREVSADIGGLGIVGEEV